LEFWRQTYRTDWTPARVCLDDDDEEEEEENLDDTRAELENDTDARFIFLF